MNFQCPFDRPNARQVANFPCKFQEHPNRPYMSYCTVCGQHRHINRVGRLIPTWMLLILLLATIWFILKADPKPKNHNPQQKTQNTITVPKLKF